MASIHITGGAGFIGINLARYLAAEGHQVSSSDVRSRPLALPDYISYGVVDLTERDKLAAVIAAARPSVVVHLGARTDLHGRCLADYAANTNGVRNIIAACQGCPSVKRVLFASSRMVCRINYVPVDYSDYCPPNAYGESKVVTEKIVRAEADGFEWAMFRPTSIWGPYFGIPYRTFFDQIRAGRYFHPSSHNPRKSFGYVGNTVFQLARLIEAPYGKIARRTFYMGDYHPIRIKEWADFIADRSTPRRRILTAPMPLLRAGAKCGDLLAWVGVPDRFPLTTFRLDNLITDMVYPQLKELSEVTGALPHSWQAGTEETIRWMDSTVA